MKLIFNAHIQESSQRFSKQRDEQAIEYIADGKTIGKKIIYAAETEQMNRDGSPPKSSDWDNFSDRLRKTLQNKSKSKCKNYTHGFNQHNNLKLI